LFLLHIICIMFGGVSDHLVLLLLINLIWFDLIWIFMMSMPATFLLLLYVQLFRFSPGAATPVIVSVHVTYWLNPGENDHVTPTSSAHVPSFRPSSPPRNLSASYPDSAHRQIIFLHHAMNVLAEGSSYARLFGVSTTRISTPRAASDGCKDHKIMDHDDVIIVTSKYL